jgi:hypothetical protein
MLLRETRQPAALMGPMHLWRGLFCERKVIVGMARLE